MYKEGMTGNKTYTRFLAVLFGRLKIVHMNNFLAESMFWDAWRGKSSSP
jgi:hypothetical protein